ncbi:Alpha/Beta hydrolase protein [Neurospora hispaniola]|uniref:Alpha/Beta hydrolase protein n=1 Tax=Neurospora hispaniola TaxID=588809 RepID=A0AAJ0IEF7_9PEZI|nr:Alpha/Beta hydrolase protein [Neurospora hispaniola]
MFRQNPNLIQPPLTPLSTSRPPLFLIHDGGGTIFSYYCLSDLHRPVYGIFNPCYSTKSTFEGGIPEMAKTYLNFIIETLFGDDQCDGKVSSPPKRDAGKELSRERDLILGGWSLGGMVSLEVSRQVLDFNAAEVAQAVKTGKKAKKLNVLGIIMIDSMNPDQASFPHNVKIANPNATKMQWGPHTKPETKEAVLRCFHEARRMLAFWELPTWPPVADADGDGTIRTSPMGPPPVVLLKAKENVPLQEPQEDEEEVSRTDVHRGDGQLGWGSYHEGMVRKVIEVEGHHFNLFTEERRAEQVTRGDFGGSWSADNGHEEESSLEVKGGEREEEDGDHEGKMKWRKEGDLRGAREKA